MAKKREIILQSTDALGNKIENKYSYVNTAATAAQIDTAARTINGLTIHTYVDTQLVETQSVNEILAEQGDDLNG